MLLPPYLIAVVLIAGFVALIPARRLHLAGAPTDVIATWLGGVWLLAILTFLAPGLARITIPVVVALVIVPFVWPGVLARLFARWRPTRPPMKNVTPPQESAKPPR